MPAILALLYDPVSFLFSASYVADEPDVTPVEKGEEIYTEYSIRQDFGEEIEWLASYKGRQSVLVLASPASSKPDVPIPGPVM